MLTTFDLDEYVYEALRAGASGFLLKDIDRARLVEAVEAVARGESLVAPTVLERLVTHYVERPPSNAQSPASWPTCRRATRGPQARGPRPLQRRDRRGAGDLARDREDPHPPSAAEAGSPRSRPGRRARATSTAWSSARGSAGRRRTRAWRTPRRARRAPPAAPRARPRAPSRCCSIAAERPASTAQLTGLNLATVPIQSGARLCCISAEDRNVSGSSTSVTAPISDSRWRVSTPSPFENDANAAPSRAATSIRISTPPTPPV